MRKILMLSASAAMLMLVPAIATAQSGGAAGGAIGGAVTGAVVGGPIGAVVGGVIGAIIGTAIVPPPQQVVAYVTTTEAPPLVTLQGDIIVGATVPANVQLYAVPTTVYTPTPTATYAYAYINGHKVVIDTQTRAVVAVLS